MKKLNLIVILGIIGTFLLCIKGIGGELKRLPLEITKEPPSQITEEGVGMRVKFYRLNKETEEKGKFLGEAELKEGKLTYDVSDKRLEKILKGDYHTMIPQGEKEGKVINKLVIYKSGTPEHLTKAIESCKHISCIGILEE